MNVWMVHCHGLVLHPECIRVSFMKFPGRLDLRERAKWTVAQVKFEHFAYEFPFYIVPQAVMVLRVQFASQGEDMKNGEENVYMLKQREGWGCGGLGEGLGGGHAFMRLWYYWSYRMNCWLKKPFDFTNCLLAVLLYVKCFFYFYLIVIAFIVLQPKCSRNI